MTGHVHFNVISALWTYIAMIVVANAVRFILNRWPVNGLTELVNAGV